MSNTIYFPKLAEALGIPDHPMIDEGIPEDAVYFSTQGSGEFNSFYGKKHTGEALEKCRNAFRGRKHTEETKEKMRKVDKSYSKTEEHRKKVSDGLKKYYKTNSVWNKGLKNINDGNKQNN